LAGRFHSLTLSLKKIHPFRKFGKPVLSLKIFFHGFIFPSFAAYSFPFFFSSMSCVEPHLFYLWASFIFCCLLVGAPLTVLPPRLPSSKRSIFRFLFTSCELFTSFPHCFAVRGAPPAATFKCTRIPSSFWPTLRRGLFFSS